MQLNLKALAEEVADDPLFVPLSIIVKIIAKTML